MGAGREQYAFCIENNESIVSIVVPEPEPCPITNSIPLLIFNVLCIMYNV